MRHALLLFLVLISGLVSPAAAQTAVSEVRGYRSVQDELAKRTNVPPRLPTFIPYASDKAVPMFAILESAGDEGYAIQLATSADCLGGNWCHMGEIRGSTRPLDRDGRRTPVVLREGLRGDFIDFTCGAHCDDSEILWNESGYYYSVSMKAANKDTLVKMVNSAIQKSKPETRHYFAKVPGDGAVVLVTVDTRSLTVMPSPGDSGSLSELSQR